MLIGQRLRELRELKHLSQGDIQKSTGLIRCYTSRIENGHTVPSVETLEKYARALGVPMYRLFYEGAQPPKTLALPRAGTQHEWGEDGNERRELRKFAKALSRLDDRRRSLLLETAKAMARRGSRAAAN
ncbi:MAG TPA: helix-turn-helix transcriptional regulator [Candidatus Dormibacteraeota bacterium]|nr:helix-turn-helix transcriptional regulator [Candidatus Dormibacteraeota bacterium]